MRPTPSTPTAGPTRAAVSAPWPSRRRPPPGDDPMEGATRAWRLMRPTLDGHGPTVTATLADGPMAGRSIETGVIEGRPPKVIDVPIDNGSCRYCLAQWTQ